MARPSNTRLRREQIVEGLLQVLGKRGYEGASTQEIARAAGLSAGLVHYHFGDKQEILLALVERLEERLRGRIERRLGRTTGSAVARLHAALDAHLALGEDGDPAAVSAWVVLCAEAVRQQEVRAAFEPVIARDLETLQALVKAALEELGRTPTAARPIAAALIAAIQGYYVLSSAAPGVTPPGSAAAAAKRMAEGLLTAAPARAGASPRRGARQ